MEARMPAKKKTVKKTTKKSVKKPASKAVKRVTKKPVAKKVSAEKPKSVSRKAMRPSKGMKRDRISIVLRNLVLFGILFILSVVIALVTNNDLIEQLFWILAILTAFVAIAFLIILLVFVFMRQIKK